MDRDLRPAMVFDDVKNLDVDGFRSGSGVLSQPIVWMKNVVDALVRGSHPAPSTTFLRVSGTGSRDIKLLGNDLTRVQRSVELQGVPKSAVAVAGNLEPSDSNSR